jgi:hypothetical protein
MSVFRVLLMRRIWLTDSKFECEVVARMANRNCWLFCLLSEAAVTAEFATDKRKQTYKSPRFLYLIVGLIR